MSIYVEERLKREYREEKIDQIENLEWIAYLEIPSGIFGIAYHDGKLYEIRFAAQQDTPHIREGVTVSESIKLHRELYITADKIIECVQHDYE